MLYATELRALRMNNGSTREYALCNLPTKPTDLTTSPDVRVIDFLLQEEDQEKVLDVVEVSFRLLTRRRSSPEWQSRIPQEKLRQGSD